MARDMRARGTRLKLFGRMLLLIGLSALLPMVAVILIATVNSYRTVDTELLRFAEEEGRHCADHIGAELASRVGALKAISAMLASYEAMPAEGRRPIIASELRSAFEGEGKELALWTQWEPGALGDRPRKADPSPGAASGSFYAIWYRAGGSLVQGYASERFRREAPYARARELMAPVLIDPYLRSYTGSPSALRLVSSISVPILAKGEFKGVVGLDLSPELFGETLSGCRILKTGYAILVASNGMRVWHPLPAKIGSYMGDDLPRERQLALLARIAAGEAFSSDKLSLVGGAWSRQFFIPISSGTAGGPWYIAGTVPFSELNADANHLALLLSAVGLVSILVVGLAIYLSARSLSAPIASLSAGARRIAGGDLSWRVEVEGADEVAELAASFNEMAAELQRTLGRYEASNRELASKNLELEAAQESLRGLNASLEAKVEERTERLSEANRSLGEKNAELGEALERLKLAQEQLVASEKLAALGRLSESVAHELNTPLGAIRSSIELIISMIPSFYESLPAFFSALVPAERELFNLLVRRGRESASQLAGTGERSRRRSLVARLAARGLPEPELLADDIESLGAFDLEEEIAASVEAGKGEILDFAVRIASLYRADEIIRLSADKAALAVSALMDYSRPEELGEAGPFDPKEDIETLLLLYRDSLKGRVEVLRSFEEGALAFGYRERLSHVWMNLIDNALEAMEYRGRLEIGTSREGGRIAVSFTDSGPGIDEESRKKIFQPFFTTKKPGEGTGLGLDTCRKIVERSGGEICFETRPGRTIFTVFLDAAAPSSEEIKNV